MNLLYLFPFWVITEQKDNEVGRLLYRWPSLTSRTKSPPKTLSRYSLFLCWKGMLISQPTHLLIEKISAKFQRRHPQRRHQKEVG